MKILSNKKYNELILKSCKGMFGAVTDDMLLRDNALLDEENKQLKDNWNELKKWLEENESFDDYCNETIFTSVLDKMQELEQGSDSNESK